MVQADPSAAVALAAGAEPDTSLAGAAHDSAGRAVAAPRLLAASGFAAERGAPAVHDVMAEATCGVWA